MAVGRVEQREIVEVPYQLPDGSIKPHMALVLSTEKLLYAEEGFTGIPVGELLLPTAHACECRRE